MEDMIAALQTSFIVSEAFRFNLKANIASYSHYDEGFNPSGASIETYESNKLITHSGKEYYLTGWDYNTCFSFYLCEVGSEDSPNTITSI